MSEPSKYIYDLLNKTYDDVIDCIFNPPYSYDSPEYSEYRCAVSRGFDKRFNDTAIGKGFAPINNSLYSLKVITSKWFNNNDIIIKINDMFEGLVKRIDDKYEVEGFTETFDDVDLKHPIQTSLTYSSDPVLDYMAINLYQIHDIVLTIVFSLLRSIQLSESIREKLIIDITSREYMEAIIYGIIYNTFDIFFNCLSLKNNHNRIIKDLIFDDDRFCQNLMATLCGITGIYEAVYDETDGATIKRMIETNIRKIESRLSNIFENIQTMTNKNKFYSRFTDHSKISTAPNMKRRLFGFFI